MKVGDYVRTIYGIKKVEDIVCGQDVRFDNTDGFDDYLKRYHDYDGISFEGSAWKEIVERTSPNIIDLIEIGDYVNGERVINIIKKHKYLEVSDEEIVIDENDIKSILTKEQFESMEYKIGE